MRVFVPFLAASVALALPNLAGAALQHAPAPAKPVEVQRYLGQWYEIARLHNMMEDGCAASSADYTQAGDGKITAVEICKKATGGTKVWRAGVRILDPGVNAKLRLSFLPFISKEYWVLDHAADYSWAIVGTEEGKYLWLFARQPNISPAEKAAIVARAKALGYDTSRLIYPQLPVTRAAALTTNGSGTP